MVAEPDLTVELTVPVSEAELAADDMWQAGATAVALNEDGGRVRVSASFPTPEASRQVAAEMADRGAALVQVDPSWRDAWRQFARPVEVGAGLIIAPAWRDVPVGSDRLVLRIDPGPCFGSGSHPSTRMILAALDRRPPGPEDRVLDVGCGSGILSVAAARLGARSVTAIDIDFAAVEATTTNAEANDVAYRATASVTSLREVVGRFDLALVNVTAAVQAELGPDVCRRVRPGGRILIAGLLPGQWRHVERAYRGAVVVARSELDGWEGLELTVTAAEA